MPELDTGIVGGTVLDGSLADPTEVDIGLRDGRIAAIGPTLEWALDGGGRPADQLAQALADLIAH